MVKIRKINKIKYMGIILILVGLIFGVIPLFNSKIEKTKENKKIEEYINQEPINKVVEHTDKKVLDKKTINYTLVIEVPKIGLKKGLYGIDSKYNSVKYNIEVLKESKMPSIKNTSLFLASHNGNSSVSYFDKLYKLENKDKVYIYYNNVKYIYEINENYEVDKTGTISIKENNNVNLIYLITCKKHTKDKQLVYVGTLIKEETY